MTTTLTELRAAITAIKAESGSGSKQRKQDRFKEVYTPAVGHLIVGERYDAAGIGPSTAKEAAEEAFDELPDEPTLSESIAALGTQDGNDSAALLVDDLDELANLSGNDQLNRLVAIFEKYTEPSIISLALLDDESFGLGTSQMREVFVPELTRSERKRKESLVEGTVEFINRAKRDQLPDKPEMFIPFDVMLAKPESAGRPDNAVAQPKIDGYRLVIHVDEGEARAFTRRKKDVTHSLPELNDIEWPAGSFIIDGEVIASDGTYSTTSSRVGKKPENIDDSTEMNFACFDLIVANGDDLSRKSYKNRHQRLEKVVLATNDPRVYQLEATSEIDEMKKYARAQGLEGVIIKDLNGEYEFGTRSSLWTKEKNQAETVDVVAAGFDEGEGRLDGTLGRIKLESADGEPVGYTGSGFSDADRKKVWNNRDKYLGKTLEVEGEAFDGAIRFPIFQRWRADDGEPDSLDRIKEILGGAA